MNQKIEDYFKDIPETVSNPIEMVEANVPIEIYKGEFKIINDNDKAEINVHGEIRHDWFPSSGAHFYGVTQAATADLISLFNEVSPLKIYINGFYFGEAFLSNTQINNSGDQSSIKGTMIRQVVLGDSSVAVEKLVFSVPNLRRFRGQSVKKIINENPFVSHCRLKLENEKYIILLDESFNYDTLFSSLKEKGGYVIMHNGELISKKGNISFNEISDIFSCFNSFLSFLNGRRTSALFIHGIFEDKTIWCDYTNYIVNNQKFVKTWPQNRSVNGLNELWKEFSSIWQDSDDRDFLKSVIHWYVEVNNKSGLIEGSIVMAQTALELLYNWWLIEKKRLIIGKDSESISASNKIRLLLSQLNISSNAPKSFSDLQKIITENKDISDAPDAIVQIRNAIVHDNSECPEYKDFLS